MQAELSAKIVTTSEDWRALEKDWQELFEHAINPTVFLAYPWLGNWWEQFGAKYGGAPGGLRVVTIREGCKLIAALPLYLQVRRTAGVLSSSRLLFIGTGESPDETVYAEKLDVLHPQLEENKRSQVMDLLRQFLRNSAWDEFDTGILRPESLLMSALPERGPALFPLRKEYPGPWVDLGGGFETYLAKRSSNARQQFRRHMRDAEKMGLAFTLAQTADERERYLEELIMLHQARWNRDGKPGAFFAQSVRDFHAGVVSALSSEHTILARLGNEQAETLLYGFRFGSSFDFVQSGVRAPETSKLRSPGLTAHLLLMQALSRQGVTRYDLLAGGSDYKDKLATSNSAFSRCRMLKLTLGNAFGIVDEVRHKILSRLSRKSHASTQELQPNA